MAKRKGVSAADMSKVMKFVYDGEATTTCDFPISGETINVTVKRFLSVSEEMSFVSAVLANTFITDATGKEVYCPSVVRYAIADQIFSKFTNIADLSIDMVKAIVDTTSIVDVIAQHIDTTSFENLRDAVYAAIAQRKQELCVDKTFDMARDMARLESAMEQFNDTMNQFSELFDNVDVNSIIDAANNISNYDELSVARAGLKK